MQRIFKKFILTLFFVVLGLNNVHGSEITQNAEKALAVMALPVGLASHANIQNPKTAAYIKLLDDVLVIMNNGFSFYNKSINDSRDLSYYKVLDVAYRFQDIAAQVRCIKNSTEATAANNQTLLTTVRALSFALIQSAARVHIAFNTTDTEEQRKIRYWCDAVAFFSNRLSDLTSSSNLSQEEFEYQMAGIATGLLLLLAYTPERLQIQVAVDRAQEVIRAGRRVIEDGGRAGRRLLKEGGAVAGRAGMLLRNGKRAFADLYDSLAV